jgi:4-carboxymuconolactone decarboxylase
MLAPFKNGKNHEVQCRSIHWNAHSGASHLGDCLRGGLLLTCGFLSVPITMTERLSQIRYEDLAADVRPLADDILKVSSAALGGPYNALLRSPDMARRAFDFLDYLRFRTSVNKRLNEFAILIQARISNAQYEWWAHERIARKAGLSDTVMRDLQQCQRPTSMQADERLVYDYCVQLSLNHRVPDALWQEAVAAMGEQAVVDLTVLSGTYVMVSMLLNATQVGIPDGGEAPLQVMDPQDIRQRLLA